VVGVRPPLPCHFKMLTLGFIDLCWYCCLRALGWLLRSGLAVSSHILCILHRSKTGQRSISSVSQLASCCWFVMCGWIGVNLIAGTISCNGSGLLSPSVAFSGLLLSCAVDR